MKKSTLLVLGISSLLVLAGCTNSNSSSSNETPSSEHPSSSSIETKPSSEETASSSSSSTEQSSSSSSSSSEEAKEYDIFVTTSDGATITGIPSKAEAGEEVHFTLTIAVGFKLSSIAATSGTNSVELTAGFDGDYSFTMPKRGVSITVKTARESYELTTYDSQGFIQSVQQQKVGSTTYTDLETVTSTDTDDEGEEITSTFKAAEYGAIILVTYSTNVTGYVLSGITVGGKEIDLETGKTSFTFVMDHEATSITTRYTYTPISVKTTNSEHISLSLFESDKVTAVTNSYIPYEVLYVQATASDEDYGVRKIVYSYKDGNSEIKTVDFTSSLEDGYYHFTLPMVDNEITITVTEYNLHAYKDYSFVGEYSHLDFSYAGARDLTAFDSVAKMTITESGDVNYVRSATATYADYSIGSVSGTQTSGTASLNKAASYSTASFSYSGDVLVYDSYLRESVNTSNDIAIAFKQSSAEATYLAKGTQFKIGDTTYALATFYENNVNVQNVLIERGSKNTIHFDVDVEILEGTYVSDAKAVFTVKDGETTLLKIGYTGNGGATNRVTLGDEYGTYTAAGDKTLILDGVSSATYDGAVYSYTIASDGVTITLTSNSKTIIGTIDLATMTFTVLSEEEVTGLPWYGKTYKGTAQWSSSDTEAEATYTVAFHSNENKFDIKCSYGPFTKADIDYEVSNGTTVTTKFYDAANKSGFSVTMTYNASSDTFTVKGGVTGAYFNNAKFSLVS